MRPPERAVLAAHAIYFAVTGLWPLIHYRSFEAVTGPKRDAWLVKTLGVFILPVALAGASATVRDRVTPEVRAVTVGSSLALGWSSGWYALRGRIRRIYLGDALVEGVLVAGLLIARRR
jgi:hypothetical protein